MMFFDLASIVVFVFDSVCRICFFFFLSCIKQNVYVIAELNYVEIGINMFS